MTERRPSTGGDGGTGPIVVLVHGSLDRAASFGRAAQRLRDLVVVTYDRRGYAGSRAAGVAPSLRTHVDDLVALATAVRGSGASEAGRPRPPVSVVGHSVGGTIALFAAVAAPGTFASVGAYEPSMPWLGFHPPEARRPPGSRRSDPGEEAERFFRRMMGDVTWDRIGERARDDRRADGPALVADLDALRGAAPFDVTTLRIPGIVSAGGPSSFPHHRASADWLAARVPGLRRAEIPAARHGAHLSHPDAYASFVRDVVALAPPGTNARS